MRQQTEQRTRDMLGRGYSSTRFSDPGLYIVTLPLTHTLESWPDVQVVFVITFLSENILVCLVLQE